MARSMNWWASWRVHRRMNWWVARDMNWWVSWRVAWNMNWWVHRRGAGRIMSGRVMRWVSGRKMSWWASGRVNRRVSRGLVMVMVVVVVVVVTGSGGFYRGVRATTVVRWKRTIDDSLSLFTKNSGEAAQQEQRHHKTLHLCLFSGHSEVS